MGRHARKVSDRRLTVVLVWQGFGSIAMAAAMLAIAVIGLGGTSGSGPLSSGSGPTAEAPIALWSAMHRLSLEAFNAEIATKRLFRE